MGVMAEKYQDVISLGIGEPGFTTPANIIEAAADALRQGYTKYTPNKDYRNLRAAIAAKLERDNGLAATADNVIVTTGAGEAIMLALLALVNPGDEVIYQTLPGPTTRGKYCSPVLKECLCPPMIPIGFTSRLHT
jgi:aspartate/methionine/tyrosine aminotransferase